MNRRRLIKILAPVVAALALTAVAFAYFVSSGTGSASATTATVSAASISVPSSSTGSVLVTFDSQASAPSNTSHNGDITYRVQRKLGAGSFANIASGGCAGDLAYNTASCTDTAGDGSYTYRVVADFHNFRANSSSAGPVVVNTDTTPPAVQSITRADSNPTNSGSVSWTVTFSEPVSGVGSGDFVLTQSGLGGTPAVTDVTGSGTTYTVTASTGSGSGSLRLDVADDDSIQDGPGNKLGGTGTGNGDFTSGQVYTIDRAAPSVSSIDRADSNPTNASSVSWTVTFSKSVTGVNAADFALANTGLATPAITNVTGSGTTYVVTASTGSGSGSLGLNLADDDSITDSAGNKLGGTGSGNGNFTGQVYTIDKTAPTLSTLQMFDTNGNGKIDRVVATFNENLRASSATAPWSITSGPSGASTVSAVGISAGSNQATVDLTEGPGAADTAATTFRLALTAAANGVVDTAGNQASFTNQQPADKAAPVLTQLQMLDNNTDGKVDRVTAAFSEPLAASTASGPWALTNVPSNGSLASVSIAASATSATLTLTQGTGAADTSVGTFKVALNSSPNPVADLAGNAASFTATAPADKAGPVPVSYADTDGTTDGLAATGDTFTVTFSENVNLPNTSSNVTFTGGNGNNADSIAMTNLLSGTASLTSGSYISGNGSSATFFNTLSQPASNQLRVTLAGCSGACASLTAGSAGNFTYTPVAAIVDGAANAATGNVTQSIRLF